MRLSLLDIAIRYWLDIRAALGYLTLHVLTVDVIIP